MKPVARWASGAYLLAGENWICLSLDPDTRTGALAEYTHLAFSVDQLAFAACVSQIESQQVTIWKANSSEGDSLYFLDPDGHKLEIHCGDLGSRLAALKRQPFVGLEVYV